MKDTCKKTHMVFINIMIVISLFIFYDIEFGFVYLIHINKITFE